MLNFVYYTPTKVVFGKGSEKETGKLIKEQGAKSVLIHYGSERVVKSGLIPEVERQLDELGIRHVKLGGVVANPHLGKVREGIELARKNDVDFVLAVGGGSVIDSCKAICYGLADPDHDVWELFAHTLPAKACFPLGSILTIAAAGSEMSNSCVITNELTGEKRAYDDNLARPRFAVMNPEFTTTLPDYQTQSGCADIMMHTMERYFNNGGYMEITDALAEGLLRTVMKNAEILHKDPKNYEARAEVMWASSLAHNGLTGCGSDGGDWSVHLLEHEMGGMFNVTHGAGLAAIWSSWARYVMNDCLDRFVKYAVNVMGVEESGDKQQVALEGIHKMEEFYHRIAMPINMRELGIEPTDRQIEEMADSCLRATGGGCGSARKLNRDDMIAIYRKAR
ncbi:MAG: iron-containing alcohol dehydrogenase [Erysipelotrichaceae bacterium]|nr:iron-containing alcohol dehydrogenase [Erysipelotrichaceae bacterium]